jgi:periplasmic protein TonB
MAARRRSAFLLMSFLACACAAPPATAPSTFPPTNPDELPPGVVPLDEATMTRPELISGPNPTYTVEAIQRGIRGTAVLRCVITEKGAVTGCRVIESLPGMDADLIRTFEQRRYKPATLGGKPVAVVYHFRVTMKMP